MAWDSLGMQERRFEPILILGEDPVEEIDGKTINKLSFSCMRYISMARKISRLYKSKRRKLKLKCFFYDLFYINCLLNNANNNA